MDNEKNVAPQSRPVVALLVAAAAVGYPPAFLVAYFFALAAPYFSTERGVNVTAPFLPLFLPLLAVLLAARYGLWRLLRRWFRGAAGDDAASFFLLAHRPALFSLPITAALCFLDMEGNVFGFLVLPILLLLCLTIGVWVQRRLWRGLRKERSA